ncbi:LPXTG cell wall anchor domain-containing protein [Actinomyces sp.]
MARTGTDATVLGGMAALTALAGALAIGTKRRREREEA